MNFAGNGLLVTEYENPELAEIMRNQGIPFIDGAGNALISATPLYIFIKGEKPDKAEKAEPVKRLFKPGGLKLIFALLNNPGMEKAAYRDMAKAAKVALGTVNFVITELIYRFKFQKDPNGNVEILMPFWDFKWELAENGFVPPLLIYADLVATGDVRTTEAAEIIYDKYIARLVRKDR